MPVEPLASLDHLRQVDSAARERAAASLPGN
jgi:hypothetical protein